MIGACLLSPAACDVLLRELSPNDFYGTANRHLAEGVTELHKIGQAVDAVTLAGWVADRYGSHPTLMADLVAMQTEVASTRSAPTYAARIRDRSARRQLWADLQAGVEEVLSLDVDVEEAVDHVEARLRAIDIGTGADPPPLALEEFLALDLPYRWLVPNLLERSDRVIITSTEGGGKALAVDTPILTGGGWTTMGEIEPGAEVYGPDGQPTKVIAASEVMTGRPCYQVRFSDGSSVVADAEHLWVTHTLAYREKQAYLRRRGETKPRGTDKRHMMTEEPTTLTTRRIGETLRARGGHCLEHAIPIAQPFDAPRADLLNDYRYIVAVEPVPSVPVRCLQVDREDGMYLVGEEMIATHNSTMLRQLAVQLAMGLHPFARQTFDPVTTLVVDVENSLQQVQRGFWPLFKAALSPDHQTRMGEQPPPAFDSNRVKIEVRQQGIDLLSRRDRQWFTSRVEMARPDVILTGPLYKLHRGDPIKEEPASELAAYFDELRTRYDCALLLEAHAPHGMDGGKNRTLRPFGASLWMRWPEFGYGIRPSPNHAENDEFDLVSWRGARDASRVWPRRLRQGRIWPWINALMADQDTEPAF